MALTLEQQANSRDNDYSALEAIYRAATGGELVSDPFRSPHHPVPEMTLSASVVIPAWNARDTIEACLLAIEQSSFNQKYPDRLEVVVVDDGSTDDTWAVLERLRPSVRLKAVQQVHHSRAQTQNTGIAVADGDVIISCDADMILAPFAIEELVKRHQVLDRVMLIGFRSDVARTDPRIQPHALPHQLPNILPPFMRDVRLNYGAGGWPESMCRDSDHLKRLGKGKQIWMADGARWNLPGMVYGALFSLHRETWMAMEGYDERFYGWGCEDTLVGVRVVALGCYILPVYGAAGLHIAHSDRSTRKWQEFAANRRVFGAILRAPFVTSGESWQERAKRRVRRHFEREPAESRQDELECSLLNVLDNALTDGDRRGKYLHALGRYDEAAIAFGEVEGDAVQEAWALFDHGKALRAGGHPARAIPPLEEAAARLPGSPWPPIEWGLALAAQGRFKEARSRLERAWQLDPPNSTVAFLLQQSASRHLARAEFYTRHGDHALAIRDYEAALIQEPHHSGAQAERALAMVALGQRESAKAALSRYTASFPVSDVPGDRAHLELARLHLAAEEINAAKVALERARRNRPRSAEVRTYLQKLNHEVARAFPLPDVDRIVTTIESIPGWLGKDEAALLVRLVMRAVACCRDGAPTLLEIGSYCGRATVAMALAAQSLGCTDARIVAVEEPTLGPSPDGRPAWEVLCEHLDRHRLSGFVMRAPEMKAGSGRDPIHLLLVDGQHEYEQVRQDFECYSARLVTGGLLVFHDYADYFPGVQQCVDEVLLAGTFGFVAQASTLMALARREHNDVEPVEAQGG